MPVSKELLLSILALDAYNQGYGRGYEHGKTKIGTATVQSTPQSVDVNLWEPKSFFAAAYDTPYGTVISYRGTDDPGSDAWTGWLTGGGVWWLSQARLAAEFYQAVTGTTDGDPRNGSAILTGHSLGGGLAGVPAAIAGAAP